jgi:DNA-binding HxlR family transcriptional regulator
MNAPELPQPTPSETCATQPLGRALRLLGDAPTLLIIFTLLRGARRFGEIRMALDGFSPKTIVQRLKTLEDLGFLRRHAFAEIPPRVEYDLTDKGFALADIMSAIEAFGARYLADSPDAALSATSTEQPDSTPDDPAPFA